MNLCVCIKVVPDRDDIDFDSEKGMLRRAGASMAMNPGDLVALEAACQLREAYGAIIHGVCMGPASALAALQTGFFSGADELFLLTSSCFAGADVAATAYTLRNFFAAQPAYDLILCGKFSSDGNTGQLGAALAAQLNLPHLANVIRLSHVSGDTLEAWQRLDGVLQKVRLSLPALCIIETDFSQPRTPTLKQVLRARGKSVATLKEHDFPSMCIERCGLKGSKTRIRKIFVPERTNTVQMIPKEQITTLASLLAKGGL